MRSLGIVAAPVLVALVSTLGAHRQAPGAGVRALAAEQTSPRAELIARAKSLELNTPYVPPPGDPLEHHAAGFAQIMCSAVFITGLDPDFAAENVGFFVSPYAERAKLGKPVVDRAAKTVRVAVPNGVALTARYLGSQGCVTLPVGATSVGFTPLDVKSVLPDASKQSWPMGDLLPDTPLPPGLDVAKVKRAVDAAYQFPEEMSARSEERRVGKECRL